MVSITLDERDEAILERIKEGDADVTSLAADVDCSDTYLRERLPQLADNGLVQQVEDDGYAITENGERVLAASPAGTRDDQIDTPEDVEQRLDSFDIRTDYAAAVRAAFSFLRYWGEATTGEIVDAVYSEHPAGVESSEQWWNEFVRDPLAALPHVEAPGSTDPHWRYDGQATIDKQTDDGRVAPEDSLPSPGSVRLATEQLDLTEVERATVRAAFDHLVREGEASVTELQGRAYPDHGAGYETADEWWSDCVGPAFDALPGVEPVGDSQDRWQHRQSAEGTMSTDPGSDDPGETTGPTAEQCPSPDERPESSDGSQGAPDTTDK